MEYFIKEQLLIIISDIESESKQEEEEYIYRVQKHSS
jgi:hypothetical protein